ncbi:MAG: hypothetical protein KJ052_09835 [Candidatus Hydrogenedentes bacterium]|nr:hypothetical protein [Candidatus Hydrogenedentota bacterium]
MRYFQKPTSSRAILLAFMLACAMGSSSAAESPGTFETLGVPVVKAGLMGFITGPGPDAGSERIYFNFRQDGGTLFLVAVDPVTGTAEQFSSPVGTGGWAFMVGPDDRIYLGTHEGPEESDNGQILVFDPRQPEKAIQVVGRPSETETYLWMYTLGADGKIYGCTYPNAKLVSYDPATGELVDHGVMDDSQKYSRSIAAGPDGRIYTGIGYGRANVVMFDPKTGEHKGILPDEFRSDPAQTVATVYEGEDGNVYVQAIKMTVLNGDPENGEIKEATSVTLLVQGDKVEEAAAPSSQKSRARLKDGRTIVSANLNGEYTLALSDGSREDHAFTYKGDGAGIFMVNTGPLGRIYGGAYMPNERRAPPKIPATRPKWAAKSIRCSSTAITCMYAHIPARFFRNGIRHNPGIMGVRLKTIRRDSDRSGRGIYVHAPWFTAPAASSTSAATRNTANTAAPWASGIQ